jgi:hypothetical protein
MIASSLIPLLGGLRTRIARLGLLGLALLALTACSGPSFSVRYRLTVEIDTPDGLKSASSVLELTVRDDTKVVTVVGGNMLHYSGRGEAVFVDLGRGRHVIALTALASAPYSSGLMTSFMGAFKIDNTLAIKSLTGRPGVHDIPTNTLPALAILRDIADPRTVRLITPAEFPPIFGPGFRFRRATVEMVPIDTPLTETIRSV